MDSLLQALREIDITIPCSNACDYCDAVNSSSTDDFAAAFQQITLIAETAACPTLQALTKDTRGSLVSLEACFQCDSESVLSLIANNNITSKIESSQKVIHMKDLGLSRALVSNNCSHDTQFRVTGFAEVPNLCLIEGIENRSSQGNVTQIKVSFVQGEFVTNFVDADVESSFPIIFPPQFVVNMEYVFSRPHTVVLNGDVADVRFMRILGNQSCRESIKRFFDKHKINECLSHEASFALLRNMLVHDFGEPANIRLSETSDTEHEETDDAILNLVNTESQTPIPVEVIEEDEDTDIDATEDDIDEIENRIISNSIAKLLLRSINNSCQMEMPVISDNYKAFISRGSAEFWTVENESETDKDTLRRLRENPWSLFSLSFYYEKKLALTTPEINETSLRVSVDIDSMDFITFASAGQAFGKSKAMITLKWGKGLLDVYNSRRSNNNLTNFYRGHSHAFPGIYFVPGNNQQSSRQFVQQQRIPDDLHPIHVNVFRTTTVLSAKGLKVFALFPSKVVQKCLHGGMGLIKAFRFYTKHPDEEIVEEQWRPRYFISQFLWYIESELLIFCINMAVLENNDTSLTTRFPCCIFAKHQTFSQFHTKEGQYSTYQDEYCLGTGELSVALLYRARLLCAIEKKADLTEGMINRDFQNADLYKFPHELAHLTASEEVLECLQAPIGSEICQEHFEKVWREYSNWNAFITFQSSANRRGRNAYPTTESCRAALERKQIELEDLLLLSNVLYRGTVHGTKTTCYTKEDAQNLKNALSNELNPKSFIDGTIDVAFVLRCEKGKKFDLYPRSSAVLGRSFLPHKEQRSMREINAYASTTPGFPFSCGFSTGKGKIGCPESVLSSMGVRRVKVYPTKWRSDSTRGSTIYKSWSNGEIFNLLDPTEMLLHTWKLHAGSSPVLMKNAKRSIQEIFYCLQSIQHNIHHRQNRLKLPQSSSGIRIEYTCAFDDGFSFLMLPAEVLQLQAEANEMPKELLRKQMKEQPELWPWWVIVPVRRGLPTKWGTVTYDDLPVLIGNGSTLQELSLETELSCVKLMRALLEDAISLGTQNALCLDREPHVFLKAIFNDLDLHVFWEFIHVVSTGLFSTAFHQADAQLVDIRKQTLSFPCFRATAAGLMPSWQVSGLPRVSLARLLCSHPEFMRIYAHLKKCNTSWTDYLEVDSIESIWAEEDAITPAYMKHSHLLSNENYNKAFLDSIHGKELVIRERDFDPRALLRAGHQYLRKSLTASRNANLQESMEICSDEDIMDEIRKVAFVFARILVFDIFRYLAKLSGGQLTTFGLREKEDLAKSYITFKNAYPNDLIVYPKDRVDFGRVDLKEQIYFIEKCFFTDLRIYHDETPQTWDVVLQRMFSFAKKLPQPLAMRKAQSSAHPWISMIWLRVILEIVARAHATNSGNLMGRENRLTEKMETLFGEELRHAMICHGLRRICPKIENQGVGLNNANLNVLLSEPLQFSEIHGDPPGRMNIRNLFSSALALSIRLDEKNSVEASEEIIQYHSKLHELVSNRRTHEFGTPPHVSLSRKIVDLSKEIWEEKRWLSKVLSCMLKEELDNFYIHSHLQRLDEKAKLWVKTVFDKLCQIRRVFGDEGIAAITNKEGNAISIRNCTDEDMHEISEKLTGYAVYNRPWCGLYPDPMNFDGSGIYNRNSKIKKTAAFFDKCGLFFKLKALKKKPYLIQKGQGRLNKFRGLLVDDLVDDDAQHDNNPQTSRSFWRLMPTLTVMKIALKYLDEIISD